TRRPPRFAFRLPAPWFGLAWCWLAWFWLAAAAAAATWIAYQANGEAWTPLLTYLESPARWSAAGWALNADQLTPVALYHDLARDWRNIWGWQFSRSPYLFPDYALYAAIESVVGSFRWSIFLSGAVLAGGFLFSSACLVRRLTEIRSREAVAAVILTVAVPLAALQILSPKVFYSSYFFAFFIGNHFSAYLIGVVAIFPFLRWLERPGAGAAAALFALVALGTCSDHLTALYFTAPAGCALIGLALARRCAWTRAARLALLLAAATATGLLLASLVTRQPHIPLTLPLSFELLLKALAPLRALTAEAPATWTIILLGPILCLAVGGPIMTLIGLIRLRRAGGGMDRQARGFAFFTIVAAGATATALAYLTTTLGQEMTEANVRYLMPLLFHPLLLAATALGPRLAQAGESWRNAPIVALLPLAAIVAVWGSRVPPTLTWSPPEARDIIGCRDAFGLKAGLSNYWLSKYLMIFTNWDMQIDQVLPQYPNHIYFWVNNINWYTKSISNPNNPPDYNFIILNRLEREPILRDYGPPDREVACGRLNLLIYDAPGALSSHIAATRPDLA
ncbi:MAG TPA: hypothetical protein PKZ97_18015, partial [Azospirillaceae bacterium]|nr:hypothetical protein [Azospirillaceae bacterium]